MPNSLLWVCLVAIWLFVLVPMVVKSRPAVRKTTDAALSTRVLYGGGRAMAKTRRRMAAGRHPHDPDWEPPVREYRKTAAATATKTTDEHNDTDTDSAETVLTKAAQTPVAVTTAVAPTADMVVDDEHKDVDVDAATDDEADVSAEVVDDVDGADTDNAATADDAVVEEAVDDKADHDDTLDDDLDEADLEDDEYDEYDHDLTEEDLTDDEMETQAERDEIARRARRGGFDPEADRERSDKRYRFRQRVMAVLGLLVVAGIAAGVVLGTTGWIAAGAATVVLVGYLAFLRRAVRNEQRIRRQRMQRLARAKREEEERRAHPEVDPRADIPRRLRRPGAVVLEIDDEDPIFDHLPRYQHVERVEHEPSYRRVVGQ
jgi:hypothetical protein